MNLNLVSTFRKASVGRGSFVSFRSLRAKKAGLKLGPSKVWRRAPAFEDHVASIGKHEPDEILFCNRTAIGDLRLGDACPGKGRDGPDQAIGTEPAAEMNRALTIIAPKTEAAMFCMLANAKVIVSLPSTWPLDNPAVMPTVKQGACQIQKMPENWGLLNFGR
jgi:hypothetical protein